MRGITTCGVLFQKATVQPRSRAIGGRCCFPSANLCAFPEFSDHGRSNQMNSQLQRIQDWMPPSPGSRAGRWRNWRNSAASASAPWNGIFWQRAARSRRHGWSGSAKSRRWNFCATVLLSRKPLQRLAMITPIISRANSTRPGAFLREPPG